MNIDCVILLYFSITAQMTNNGIRYRDVHVAYVLTGIGMFA